MTTNDDFEMDFYFEKRKDTAAAAERMFKAVRQHPLVVGREKLTKSQFGDKSSPELQAADLVAYEVRKRVITELSGDKKARWQSEKLLPHLHIGRVRITRKQGT